MEPKVPPNGDAADDDEILDTYLDKDHRVVKPGDGTAVLMRRHVWRKGVLVKASVWVIKSKPPA